MWTKKTNTDMILNSLNEDIWLFQKILWDKEIALYNLEKEKMKKVLYEVYWMKDVYEVIWPELDETKLDRIMTTIFRFTWWTPLDYIENEED